MKEDESFLCFQETYGNALGFFSSGGELFSYLPDLPLTLPRRWGVFHTTLNKIRKLDPDCSTCFSRIPRPKQTYHVAATVIKCRRAIVTMDTQFHYVQSTLGPFGQNKSLFLKAVKTRAKFENGNSKTGISGINRDFSNG